MADGLFGGGGAAFGVFPQMGGRRRLQDPQASADVPFQGFRGSVAGLLGLLPDVANFMGRSPMPTETFGEFDYGPRQQLPYGSEFYLKELPLAPTSPVGQLAGQVGSFTPLSPMPAIRGAQTVGRMVGQRMAENVAMGRPSLPSMLAEPRASLFAVEPSPMMPKPQAQVSELGFYSAAEQAAMNLPRNKGTGQSFLNDLMKAPDVKKDELAWTGLDDFLANKPNVTKQEVQDFIANNRVDVKEVRMGGALSPEMQTTRDALSDKYKGLVDNIADAKSQFEEGKISYAQVRNTVSNNQVQIQALDTQINEINKTISPTKYERYQLPGGENYREILLTLPFKEPAMPKGYGVTSMQYDDGTVKYFAETPTSRSQGFRTQEEAEAQLSKTANNLKGFRENIESYQSSHFNEPNILAHIRVNDRVDADGKKMLLIEEIQSDWHQAGREKGYKGKGTLKELPDNYFVQEVKTIDGDTMYVVRDNSNPGVIINKDYNRQSAINGVINELNATSAGGVPDAPFKDTWYQLALKRVLKHAADNGYERVGLTTGKQQAERFDLSKQISKVMWDKDTGRLTAYDKNATERRQSGRTVIDESGVTESKLADYIGKEAAQKLIKESPDEDGVRFLSGLDLQVGGEGMKKYYDEIYPKFLDKYGKKWNAKVGETQITTDYARDASGIPAQRPSKESIRYIDITPEMKGAVSKGQPLFAAAPVGSIGLGYQKDKADNLEETSPMYSDPFGNTIGSSIR